MGAFRLPRFTVEDLVVGRFVFFVVREVTVETGRVTREDPVLAELLDRVP